MKKKIFVLLMVIALLVPMFAACGGSETDSPSPSASPTGGSSPSPSDSAAPAEEDLNGVTIRWWNGWTSNDGNVMRELVNYYNENNKDGITVELDIVAHQALTEKITASLLSNTAPEMYLNFVSSEYAVNKQLVPIDDIWEKTKLQKDDFYEDVLEYCYWEGKLYGLPFQINGQFYYYNKDILDRAGVDYSQEFDTWDKVFEVSKAVLAMNDPNIIPGGIAPTNNTAQTTFLKTYGVKFVEGTTTADFKSLIATDPNLPDALAALKKAYDDGVFTSNIDDMASSYRGGQCATIVDGPWIIIGSKENKLNFGLNVVPGGPGGRYCNPAPVCLIVMKGTAGKQLLATYKFIEYWNDNLSEDRLPGVDGKSPVWHWSGTCGYQSYLKSVNNDPDLNKDPIFQTTALISNYFEGGAVVPPAFYKSMGMNNNVLKVMYEDVIFGRMDIPTAIATAEANLNEIIESMR